MWSVPSRRSEPSQAPRTYSGLPSMPRAGRVVGVADDAELGREEDLVAAAGDRPPDQLLVGVGAVHVGGVEERDAELEGAVDRADRLRRRRVAP